MKKEEENSRIAVIEIEDEIQTRVTRPISMFLDRGQYSRRGQKSHHSVGLTLDVEHLDQVLCLLVCLVADTNELDLFVEDGGVKGLGATSSFLLLLLLLSGALFCWESREGRFSTIRLVRSVALRGLLRFLGSLSGTLKVLKVKRKL